MFFVNGKNNVFYDVVRCFGEMRFGEDCFRMFFFRMFFGLMSYNLRFFVLDNVLYLEVSSDYKFWY